MAGREAVKLVKINYRPLDRDPEPDPGKGYVYIWPLTEPAEVGMRVWVASGDGPSPGVVCDPSASAPDGFKLSELRSVVRVVTSNELEIARARALSDQHAWVDIVRHAAGLPTAGKVMRAVPLGFRDIPPVNGKASKLEADRFGRGWWSIYKLSQEEQWGDSETRRYKEIAEHWFAIRDAAGSTERTRTRKAGTPLPPADWYPDPRKVARLRYWDGATWTEHIAP